jgi:hypothetical protein
VRRVICHCRRNWKYWKWKWKIPFFWKIFPFPKFGNQNRAKKFAKTGKILEFQNLEIQNLEMLK